MKVFVVKQSPNGALVDLETIIYDDEDNAMEEVEGLIRETPVGGSVIIEIGEMEEDEYSALPEGEW